MSLLGSGSKGRTANPKFKSGGTAPGSVNMNKPAESGDIDVVAARRAEWLKIQSLRAQQKSQGDGTLKP